VAFGGGGGWRFGRLGVGVGWLSTGFGMDDVEW
jgi:hypothetical protein